MKVTLNDDPAWVLARNKSVPRVGSSSGLFLRGRFSFHESFEHPSAGG